MRIAEIIIGIIAVILIIMNLLTIPGGSVGVVLLFSFLSFFYYILSFALLNGIRLRNIFKADSYKGIRSIQIILSILTGFALSIMLLGILFKIEFYPGEKIMMLYGLIFVGVITIISIILHIINKADTYRRILIRTAIIGGVGLFFFILPSNTIIDIKYKEYPELAEAFKKHRENPGDEYYKSKYKEEREKRMEK